MPAAALCWRLFFAMNLNDTDFELFAVPATFAQDRAALDARWKELQREDLILIAMPLQ